MDGWRFRSKTAVILMQRSFIMVYQWRINNLYDIPAQEAGTEIESCKNGEGFITPEAVVDKARPPTSIIHKCFEWDDKNAAEKYRLHQAGNLIRNLVVVNVIENEPITHVRAFVNIKGESERGYKTISTVVHNPGEYDYSLNVDISSCFSFIYSECNR
jgi:hypothetical protein